MPKDENGTWREPNNADHAEAARTALAAYTSQEGYETGDSFTNIVDLIGDLLHLADAESKGDSTRGGFAAMESAENHYDAEQEEVKVK